MYNLNIYYQKSSINSHDKRIHMTVRFLHLHFEFTFTFTFSPPLQPQNITSYFCYRPTIFLLFYLFTFLPLNAFLPLLANNLGQLLHFS